ncbi:hypothetical protein DFH28DRAFT_888301, partial [Melampsora americana]
MSISPQKPKATERRKHVCRCESYECNLGVHLDAYGNSQVGVELSPTAYEAHQRAERRRLARMNPPGIGTSTPNQVFNLEDPHQVLTPLVARLNLGSQDHINEGGIEVDSTCKQHFGPTSSSTTPFRDPEVDLRHSIDEPPVCDAALFAQQSGVKPYDCAKFYECNLKDVNVLVLNAVVTTAIMSLFDHSSDATASWLLDVQRITIELALTHGLLPKSSPSELLPLERKLLGRIPQTIATVLKWLNIDPTLTFMNCCQACFALYPLMATPQRCVHRIARIPGGPPGLEDP